jgi:hypothetical protein
MKKGNFQKIERMASQIKWAFFIFLILALIFVVYSGVTMAATDSTQIITWASEVRGWVSTLIGALALLMIVAGGIMYAVSAGNPKQITAAKDIIISAIAGVVLYLLSAVLLGGYGSQGIINKLFPPAIVNYREDSSLNSESSSDGTPPESQSGADGSDSKDSIPPDDAEWYHAFDAGRWW